MDSEKRVKAILERAEDHEWSLQGMGMFRHYLSKEVRLHVWDARFMAAQVTTLHDHPWAFESEILSGAILDRWYLKARVDGPPTHEEHQIVCGPGGGLTKEPRRLVRLFAPIDNVFTTGRSYTRQAEDVHESVAKSGTVTIIRRTFRPDTEHAHVYVKIGKPWVSAEPRKATLEEVRAMADLALDRWEGA
jgi:hypothetical protein